MDVNTIQTSYGPAITAIVSFIIVLVSRFDPSLNIQAGDIVDVVFSIIGLVAAIIHFVAHVKSVNKANNIISGMYEQSSSQ